MFVHNSRRRAPKRGSDDASMVSNITGLSGITDYSSMTRTHCVDAEEVEVEFKRYQWSSKISMRRHAFICTFRTEVESNTVCASGTNLSVW
jgi:hypothetical protein